jgi:predicted GIY-YIG superfamily endonuclease
VFIYGLLCPIKNTIDYVGQTNNLEKRLISHLSDKHKSMKNNWIKSLRKKGLKPSNYSE